MRILIADDHGVVRAALRALLASEGDFEVVGEAGTGDEAMRLTRELCPDVVLLDLSMPGPDGIQVTRSLKANTPQVRVVILTASEDRVLLQEALRAGASGYVVKRAVESELAAAIAAAMRGDMYVHPSVTRGLLEALAPAATAPAKSGDDVLTTRELDVLRLIALGHTNLQIAETLSLSKRTIESHRANIMSKLGARNRADLVRYAVAHGLGPDE